MSLLIDFTQEDAVLQVYPRSPVLSSKCAAWQGIDLAYYHQPVHATPEYAPAQYIISIHLGSPATLEQQWRDRGCIREHQTYGDITIYPASYFVREKWDAEAEFMELYLAPTLLALTAHEITGSDSMEIVPYTVARDPLIQSIGLALKAELESAAESTAGVTPFPSSFYVESAAYLLSAHLLKHYSTKKPTIRDYTGRLPDYKLRRVIAYIDEHLAEDISLDAIANSVSMSQHHFGRLFKKSTGLAPYQYVIKVRISRAKQLLLQGKLSITEVALEVGFASQSHFTQHFKRLTGVTPKQLLKS